MTTHKKRYKYYQTHPYDKKVEDYANQRVVDCPIRVSANYVFYQGEPTEVLKIKHGDRLENIIKVIDRKFAELSPGVINHTEGSRGGPEIQSFSNNEGTESNSNFKSGIHIENFRGIPIIKLDNHPTEIISVIYCGIELDPLYYMIKGDILYINLKRSGVVLEATDPIKVIYI